MWNREGLRLTIRIVPPFWRTWWFRLAVVAVIALGLATWFQLQLAAHRRRQRELVRQVDLRTADLAEANRRIADQNVRLEELSRTDPLTGLGNRRVMEERLPLELAILRRQGQRAHQQGRLGPRGLGILLVDIDHFKEINDRHGHEAGDAFLRTLATTLQGCLREVDLVVRWGGDEFVVLTRRQSPQGLHDLTAKIQHAIAEMNVRAANGTTIRATTSTGFVLHPLGTGAPLPSGAWPRLVDAADHQMYLAKARGRARACGLLPRPGQLSTAPEQRLLQSVLAGPASPPEGVDAVEISALEGTR